MRRRGPGAARREPGEYTAALDKQRLRLTRLGDRLEAWRRLAMRYHRCAHTCFSAICIPATRLFRLGPGPSVSKSKCVQHRTTIGVNVYSLKTVR